MFESVPPLTMTFDRNATNIPVSLTLLDDEIEEGFENFTLTISLGDDETVQIVVESAMIHIKDDDGVCVCVCV